MPTSHVSFRACPICQSKKASILGHLNYALFDDLDLSGSKILLVCCNCGMLYDGVDFSEAQLMHYYRQNEHYAASEKGGTGSVSEDNNLRYDRILDQLHTGAGAFILDFGCGQGGLVARCRARELPAAGIESSEASRLKATDSGLDVFLSLQDFVRQQKRRVSAVVFAHILEHLLDPLQALRPAVNFFPDALFYLEVPDADAYLRTDDVHWEEMYFEHLNHFQKLSLRNLAVSAGLSIAGERHATFSPDMPDIKCLTLLGQANASANRPISPATDARPAQALEKPNLCLPDGPLAIWGISQYAMLLLGTEPDLLKHTVRLFDSSPAKIGRTIRGIRIESAAEIGSLEKNITLLIPRSKYVDQMIAEARQKALQNHLLVI